MYFLRMKYIRKVFLNVALYEVYYAPIYILCAPNYLRSEPFMICRHPTSTSRFERRSLIKLDKSRFKNDV